MKTLLLRETKIKSYKTGEATIRTLQGDSGFLTVAYVPAGIDNTPMVCRYASDWDKHHNAMVSRIGEMMGVQPMATGQVTR